MNTELTIKKASGEILQIAIFTDQKMMDDFIDLITSQETFGKVGEYSLSQVDISSRVNNEKRKYAMKINGNKARIACQDVMDLVGGYNYDRQLTFDQVSQMTVLFSPIIQCLLIARPSSAKLLIEQIIPDDVLVSSQMKEDILHELRGF